MIERLLCDRAQCTCKRKQGGIITKACRALGVSFYSVNRERLRDPLFRQELGLRIAEARRNHAPQMMALADTHVDNHLRHSLVPLWDAEGAPVPDGDFEPVWGEVGLQLPDRDKKRRRLYRKDSSVMPTATAES